jgi:DNA-binding MarR family transcriptional regulator
MARDSDASTPPSTTVATSLTAELIFAANLAASVETSRPGIDAGWAEAQRALLPREARQFLPRLTGFWWPTLGLVDFLCYNRQFDDPEAFLAEVDKWPLDRFVSVLLNGDLTVSEAHELLGDPGSARWQPRLSRFSQATPEALEALARDPEGHRRGLADLVLGSDTPLFRRAFASLNAEAASTIQTIERRLLVEAPLAVAESLRQKALKNSQATYQSYTFVPSRLIGHHHIQSWGDGHALFFLQDGSTALTGPTETGAELAEFLKVLGDRTRMDILRLLCCRPSYGKEIAASLNLTTATVSRHLDQLKAAGLVREDRADANNVKTLRYVPESLETQLERLKTYLLHS